MEGPFALPLVGNGLVQGDNVLAVEVHQSATTSSDIVFGLDLRALVTRCGVGLVLTPVSLTQGRVDWSDATYHVESAAAITGPWTSQPAITAGSLINVNSGNRFLRLVK